MRAFTSHIMYTPHNMAPWCSILGRRPRVRNDDPKGCGSTTSVLSTHYACFHLIPHFEGHVCMPTLNPLLIFKTYGIVGSCSHLDEECSEELTPPDLFIGHFIIPLFGPQGWEDGRGLLHPVASGALSEKVGLHPLKASTKGGSR